MKEKYRRKKSKAQHRFWAMEPDSRLPTLSRFIAFFTEVLKLLIVLGGLIRIG